jgi:hypothetical protein
MGIPAVEYKLSGQRWWLLIMTRCVLSFKQLPCIMTTIYENWTLKIRLR